MTELRLSKPLTAVKLQHKLTMPKSYKDPKFCEDSTTASETGNSLLDSNFESYEKCEVTEAQQYMADLCAPASSVPPPPSHRPPLALSNWHLGLTMRSPQGRCKRLCPSSTMADHAPSLAGLQSCCDMLTKRSRWRMTRLASCTCWRRS